MKNVVFQQAPHEDADFVGFLEELGFHRIVLGKRPHRFGKKLALFAQIVGSTTRLVSHPDVPRKMGTVVALGHFAFAIKILARLRLLNYERLICSHFFVRSPRWFPLFRILRRVDTQNDHYLVFSRAESQLYAEQLGIDPARLHYIPCGDWHASRAGEQESKNSDETRLPADYYFSGGYSNRDYLSLVHVFEKIRAPLVIVCSKLNTEIDDLSLPANVRVVRDVPSSTFDEYISSAKVGIVPLKHDTGSSGQTVVLRLMRQGKPVVISDVAAVRDYVEPGVSLSGARLEERITGTDRGVRGSPRNRFESGEGGESQIRKLLFSSCTVSAISEDPRRYAVSMRVQSCTMSLCIHLYIAYLTGFFPSEV